MFVMKCGNIQDESLIRLERTVNVSELQLFFNRLDRKSTNMSYKVVEGTKVQDCMKTNGGGNILSQRAYDIYNEKDLTGLDWIPIELQEDIFEGIQYYLVLPKKFCGPRDKSVATSITSSINPEFKDWFGFRVDSKGVTDDFKAPEDATVIMANEKAKMAFASQEKKVTGLEFIPIEEYPVGLSNLSIWSRA